MTIHLLESRIELHEKTLNTCYFTKYPYAIGENQKGLNVQTHEQSDQKSSSFLQR